MGKSSTGLKLAQNINNHKTRKSIVYFRSHFAHKKTKRPLKGLRASLKKHVFPLINEKACFTGRAQRDKGCVGYGFKHGKAIDSAIDKYISTGKLPKRVDPCAITVLKTLKAAKIQPVASQVHATDTRGNVATAIDMLCVEDNQPLLLELKSTMFENQFFKEKGTLLNSTLPYSDCTAALLQSEIPAVWMKNNWGLPKPKSAVMVVGPKGARLLRPHTTVHVTATHTGYCKIVRPTAKLQKAAEKYAELLLESV